MTNLNSAKWLSRAGSRSPAHTVWLAILVAGFAVTAAPAQSPYRLMRRDDNQHFSAFPATPEEVPPATVFMHWDLREFPNCRVPYSINEHGHDDSDPGNEYIAVNTAAASWTAVSPAIIILNPNPMLTPATTVGQDNINLIAWDGGVPANTALWGAAPSSVLGITGLWYRANSTLLESDVILNDRDWQWNTVTQNLVSLQTGNTAPFAVSNGDTLTIRIDNGAAQVVTFAGIATNGAATALEIGQNIANQLAGAGVYTTDGGQRVRIQSMTTNGNGTVEVTGGTAAVALAFPAGAHRTRLADVETITVHELGHFVSIHHTTSPGPPGGPVMTAGAEPSATKRALTAEDAQALNFLYTPDLGDAPQPYKGNPAHFQSLVHGAVPSRVLNGAQLFVPRDGPVHLFGHRGPAPFVHDEFEWLGANLDSECESDQRDRDLHDDGVAFPAIVQPGDVVRVTATLTHSGRVGRYIDGDPQHMLHFNGYIDFTDTGSFGTENLEIWWSGTPDVPPTASCQTWSASGNFVPPPVCSATTVKLDFDVLVPLDVAPRFWCRWRLDYGEDEGGVQNISGDLGPAVGVAQFGEVEDDVHRSIVPDQLHIYPPAPNPPRRTYPVWIVASVQSAGIPVPGEEVAFTTLWGDVTFTSGEVAPDGLSTRLITGEDGLTSLTLIGNAVGPVLLATEVAYTSLYGYVLFEVLPEIDPGILDTQETGDPSQLPTTTTRPPAARF